MKIEFIAKLLLILQSFCYSNIRYIHIPLFVHSNVVGGVSKVTTTFPQLPLRPSIESIIGMLNLDEK